MRKKQFFLYLFLSTLMISACKKDKDEDPAVFQIEYEGVFYTLNRGVIWQYAPDLHLEDHVTHGYFLPDDAVFRTNSYTVPEGDPPIVLQFFLNTPDSETFKEGTYEFVGEDFHYDMPYAEWREKNNALTKGKYTISFAKIGFDENGDGRIQEDEFHTLTSGTIRALDEYLEFDLTLTNGNSVRGRSNASYEMTFPPI